MLQGRMPKSIIYMGKYRLPPSILVFWQMTPLCFINYHFDSLYFWNKVQLLNIPSKVKLHDNRIIIPLVHLLPLNHKRKLNKKRKPSRFILTSYFSLLSVVSLFLSLSVSIAYLVCFRCLQFNTQDPHTESLHFSSLSFKTEGNRAPQLVQLG